MNLSFKPHWLALICSAGLLAASATLYVKSRAPLDTPAAIAPAPEVKAAYTPAQINQWVAPIALYPDALLSQVLMAATYPANVAQAVQWSKGNPTLQGDAAIQAAGDQPWDASVKSLVAFPQLMAMMGQDPAWVENLGNAFLAQPQEVMDAVQRLRTLAQQTGALKSTPQQTVSSAPRKSTAHSTTPAATPTVIKIEPANPQVVYVPSYNPATVYGSWPDAAYPPVYLAPPPGEQFASSFAKGLGYSLGVATTYALFSNIDWDDDDDHHHDDDHHDDDHHHDGGYNHNGDNININVNNFNHITGQNLHGETQHWQHTPYHQTNVAGGLSATQVAPDKDNQRQAAMDKLAQGGIKTPEHAMVSTPKAVQRNTASSQLQQHLRSTTPEQRQPALQQHHKSATQEQHQQVQENRHAHAISHAPAVRTGNEALAQHERLNRENTTREPLHDRINEHHEFHRR